MYRISLPVRNEKYKFAGIIQDDRSRILLLYPK